MRTMIIELVDFGIIALETGVATMPLQSRARAIGLAWAFLCAGQRRSGVPPVLSELTRRRQHARRNIGATGRGVSCRAALLWSLCSAGCALPAVLNQKPAIFYGRFRYWLPEGFSAWVGGLSDQINPSDQSFHTPACYEIFFDEVRRMEELR